MSWRHIVVEGYCDKPCGEGIGGHCLDFPCPHLSWCDSDIRGAAYFAPLLLVLWDRFRERFLWRWIDG